MDEMTKIIARIQYLIENDSKNKSQILRELHLSTSTLADWSKGKGNPSSSAIMKFARYFNVSSDYILFGITPDNASALALPQRKWLQAYDMFSESERQDIYSLGELSYPERDICSAFIRGILTEKRLKEGVPQGNGNFTGDKNFRKSKEFSEK